VTLRSYLTALTLATLLPVAIFAGIVGYLLVEEQRETFRRGAEERTLALITAVDSELRGDIETLQVLAQVRSLDEGDLGLFRRTAVQILASQPHWININLALPDGQQILNLRAPEGAALPKIPDFEGNRGQLVEAREPVVGNLLIGPVTKRWDFAVRVPIARDGKVLYVLSAIANPDSIDRLLAAQGMPPGWVGVVLDRNHRIVARTVEPEKSRGQLASQSLREALARSPSGWFRGHTIEGTEVYTPYRRSEATGWAFAMGIPASAVDAAATRATWLLVLGLLGAIGLAIALAHLVGRRISQPIMAVASATEAMGRGKLVEVPGSAGVEELRSLETGLRAAVQAQEALRRTEEQIRSVVDNVLDGIITIDEQGRIQSFNQAAEKLFGFRAPEIVGQSVKSLMPERYQRQHDDGLANYLRTGEAKIIGIGREVEGRRKDGSIFPMDIAVSEFRIGERRYFTGIVRDITERKRAEESLRASEERLRMALVAGRMGNWEWNIQSNEVAWSPDLEAIHGLAPGAFPGTFEAYKKDIHPEDWQEVQSAIARSMEQGPDHHVEYRIIRPDGAVRWVEGRGKVFRDSSGAPTRVVGVCTDITERKRAELALKEADRAKDEFLAMLSHELRNPLAALTAAAHVLKFANPSGEAAIKARRVAERQTRQMSRLVADLLDISRITLGKLGLERERLDLAETVAKLVSTWRASGRFDRHRLSFGVAPVWIDADRARIEQVTANLLDNALKFTPSGKAVKISVSKDDGAAVLCVSDEGAGLAPEAVPRVFELFAQSGEARNGGLGIGLALVKRLTEMHGGEVSASSDGEGRGATFTVRLPAVTAPVGESSEAAVHGGGGRRILIVEDNDDARHMLEAALALDGHSVRAACDGATGLALAADAAPDVALIDVGLPDMDGYEVARRLRAAPGGRRIGLIALTGYGQPEDRRRAFEAGFDTHITKPVASDRLKQIIAELR